MDSEPFDANDLLKRYDVQLKYYRFSIDDGSGEEFVIDGEGMTEDAALDALVERGKLSMADRDYVRNAEEIPVEEYRPT